MDGEVSSDLEYQLARSRRGGRPVLGCKVCKKDREDQANKEKHLLVDEDVNMEDVTFRKERFSLTLKLKG